MNSPNENNLNKKINLVVFTKYKLTHSCLKLLVENKSKAINFVRVVNSQSALSTLISTSVVDVVLFNLIEDDMENIDKMTKLFKDTPDIKVVILFPPNNKIDLTKLLKMGVSGVVGCDQKEEVLIRAIQQVAEGGVWLNQKLMAQVLGNNFDPKENGSKKIGLFMNDLLTEREIDVVEEIAKGISNKKIAKNLNISEATVRHHLSSIYGKLQLDDRLNLVIYALKNGVVSFSPSESICTHLRN